jgi:transcriptional regulator with XRE-family HTH domain
MATRITPEDALFGERLKYARIKAKKSQTGLAQEIGLTFQQIQKYEKGVNRISATRLLEFAKILNVSIDFFFRRDDIFSSNSKLAEDVVKHFKHESDLKIHEEGILKEPIKQKINSKSSGTSCNNKDEIMSDFYERTIIELFRQVKTNDTKEKIINLIKTVIELETPS